MCFRYQATILLFTIFTSTFSINAQDPLPMWTHYRGSNLDGEIWATPAFTGGAILMRTSKFLYKLSKSGS